MIKISNLSFSHKKPKLKPTLRNINLEIKEGEFVSVLGPSGCGKTTFLKILADLIPGYSGNITIDNQTPKEYSKSGKLTYFFQEANLFPWRTVKQNVRLPLEIKNKIDDKKLDKVLKLVDLKEFQDFYPRYISGGQKQKTALARGLVFDPKILYMDEPFVSLDEITKENLAEELLSIWEEEKQTIVFVTHSISEAVFLSDKILVFTGNGEIGDVLKVDISRPRNKKTRKSRDFFILTNKLREILQDG